MEDAVPHASRCPNRKRNPLARLVGFASALTLCSIFLAEPGRAQTASESDDRTPPASSASEAKAASPVPTSSTSRPQDGQRMVWTEVTTESGTMMVLAPADQSTAPPSNTSAPTEAPRSQDLTAFQPPNRSRPSLEGERYPNVTSNPGGAPPTLGASSFGVYGGFPSAVGFQFVIPTDATLAFRTGFTGLPGIGYLLTPGVEIRFDQSPGTYNIDSAYAFSNLYIGETVEDGPNTHHWGIENGLGYRWIMPDRRGVRWIAAVEMGGRWSNESVWPIKPSVRAFWMIAAP